MCLRKKNEGSVSLNNKSHTVTSKLLCKKDKEKILRKASSLKDINYYGYEDFPIET